MKPIYGRGITSFSYSRMVKEMVSKLQHIANGSIIAEFVHLLLFFQYVPSSMLHFINVNNTPKFSELFRSGRLSKRVGIRIPNI